eukprot:956370-Pelagomonas_calceolata.AAC.8
MAPAEDAAKDGGKEACPGCMEARVRVFAGGSCDVFKVSRGAAASVIRAQVGGCDRGAWRG